MADLTLKVIVTDDRIGDEEVVAQLQSRGMRVEEVIHEIGVIFGTANENALPSLQAVTGVAEVSREAEFQLPPDESKPQQHLP